MKREDLPAGAFERLVESTGRTPAEVDELLASVVILPGNIGAQLAQATARTALMSEAPVFIPRPPDYLVHDLVSHVPKASDRRHRAGRESI